MGRMEHREAGLDVEHDMAESCSSPLCHVMPQIRNPAAETGRVLLPGNAAPRELPEPPSFLILYVICLLYNQAACC